MNFFRQIMQKPWVTAPNAPDDLVDGREFALPTVKVGLRVFLAVVTVLFALLVISYFGRMGYGDWRAMSDPWLLWLNTGVLLASSVAFQAALNAVRRGRSIALRDSLLTGGFFAFFFLAGQILVWQRLADAGLYAATNPATAFFYVITGLHGLHLVGGLVAWGRTVAKLWRETALADVRLSVELCTIYWHFLLLIWLVMFGLLVLT